MTHFVFFVKFVSSQNNLRFEFHIVAEIVDEDGFQFPKKSRRGFKKNYKSASEKATIPYSQVQRPTCKPRIDKYLKIQPQSKIKKLMIKLDIYQDELREYSFYKTTITTLKQRMPFDRIIALGLGAVASNPSAFCQLAYILAVQKDLGIESSILLFEPCLTSLDIELITQYPCEIDSNNKLGKYAIEKPTLFFMPHCGVRLYSNLMWANWSEHLKDITYIGNSLSSYEYVKSVKDKKNDETNTIDILLPYFTEVPFNLSGIKKDNDTFIAFNRTSIHYISDEEYQKIVESSILTTRPSESFEEGEITSSFSEDIKNYSETVQKKE